MSAEYPLVFEKLAQKPWLNPADVPETLEPILVVVEGISLVTELTDDEAAGLKILDMPFLDDIEGEETELLDHLWEMVGGRENSYNTFLDHLIANGGLTGNETRVDVQYAYMVAQDSAGMNRVFRGELPDSDDSSILGKMITLYQRYPEAYFAASEHFTKNFQLSGRISNIRRLAAIDEDLAQRLAQMPFNGAWGGLSGEAWVLTIRATEENVEAVSSILETYETGGGIEHSDLGAYVMDMTSVFSPNIVETVRTFEWVADGLDAPRFREDDRGTRAIPSDEDSTVSIITMSAWRGETWLETLLGKGWLMDDLTSDEHVVVNRLSQFESEVTEALLDMQFLDEVDREDSLLLVPIRNFLTGGEASQASRLSTLLNDSRINGEITDANRHLLESVIADASG